jgi:hypothetical protein
VCVCVCVYSCISYPAMQSNIFYNLHYTVNCVVCLVLQYFPHYFIHGTIFGKPNLFNKKCVFWFCLQFSLKHLHSNKTSARYYHKSKAVFACTVVPVILFTVTIVTILIKIEPLRQIFEESTNIASHENPSSGSRVVPCQYTNELTDMIKLIAAFRNSPNAPLKKCLMTK